MMKPFITIIIALFLISHCKGQELMNIRLYDSETIKGCLHLPPNTDTIKGCVIFVHGTGPNTYKNHRKFGNFEFNYYDLFASEFTKQNIAFFSYNRRGVEIGNTPPLFDKIDSMKYLQYTPQTEAYDIEAIIKQLKKDKRLESCKIGLLGASEGTIIASLVADRKKVPLDALFLFGYANDKLMNIIKWQLSGAPSIINIRKYFNTEINSKISKNAYEKTDSLATVGRAILGGASFHQLDVNHDGFIDSCDFATKTIPFYNYLIRMIDEENGNWIWKNYFRITIPWLKAHKKLEANKSRMLRINIPIYIFQGEDDGNVPVTGVYDLQQSFTRTNKHNLTCFFFPNHNHDLNYMDYHIIKEIPEGLKTIFTTVGKTLH